jgi:hypothetical protein
VNLRNVRMIECREQLGFALETRESIDIRGQGARQHLDRDGAFEVDVGRPINLAHSAGTDSGGDFEGAYARAGDQAITWVCAA